MTSSTCTTGIISPFESLSEQRQRVADAEIHHGDDAEDRERAERDVVQQLTGAGQFHEADQCGNRRVLDQLDREVDGRAERDAYCLWQDHVTQLLKSRERQRL